MTTESVTEKNIKEKIKLNMYNKREIPISNYKQIEDSSKNVMLIEWKNDLKIIYKTINLIVC